ncbi:MAG: YbaB/EbfC family nucleoid-associated protein [Armatimonadetes bacterium]|nr:YbaB/EbfC family nucleoid-associated protein [Armatimonadota bacterium]
MSNPFANLGGLGNLGGMMKQIKKLYEDIERAAEELNEERVEATSGGGMIKVVATGKGEIVEVKIDPKVVDPNDVEMLEDLVTSAVREAIRKANEIKAKKMEAATGGLPIPGIM